MRDALRRTGQESTEDLACVLMRLGDELTIARETDREESTFLELRERFRDEVIHGPLCGSVDTVAELGRFYEYTNQTGRAEQVWRYAVSTAKSRDLRARRLSTLASFLEGQSRLEEAERLYWEAGGDDSWEYLADFYFRRENMAGVRIASGYWLSAASATGDQTEIDRATRLFEIASGLREELGFGCVISSVVVENGSVTRIKELIAANRWDEATTYALQILLLAESDGKLETGFTEVLFPFQKSRPISEPTTVQRFAVEAAGIIARNWTRLYPSGKYHIDRLHDLLARIGDTPQARAMLEQKLAIVIRHTGADSPSAAEVRRQLAWQPQVEEAPVGLGNRVLTPTAAR